MIIPLIKQNKWNTSAMASIIQEEQARAFVESASTSDIQGFERTETVESNTAANGMVTGDDSKKWGLQIQSSVDKKPPSTVLIATQDDISSKMETSGDIEKDALLALEAGILRNRKNVPK